MDQIGAFLPLILIFGVFYILLIRPQQRKVKQHREMINNLQRGNKIITSGGIIGTISKVNENKELLLEIADNVEIKIAPGMVTDLYITPNSVKKSENNNKNEISKNNKGLLSSIFGKKEK